MFALNLGEGGRVLSATLPEYAAAGAVLVGELPGDDIGLYYYIDGELVKGNDLVIEAEAKKAAENRVELLGKLRETDVAIIEGLERLLSATSAAGLLAALAEAAQELKQILSDRASLRAEIAALDDKKGVK